MSQVLKTIGFRPLTRAFLPALLIFSPLFAPTCAVYGDDDIAGPQLVIPTVSPTTATAPAPTTAPAVVVVPTPPPATRPADEVLMQHMLAPHAASNAGAPPTTAPAVATAGTTGSLETAGATNIAPNPPATPPLREGDMISDRIGRLVKDDKTGAWLFEFESDGKTMADPPMVIVPDKLLETMEAATKDGTTPMKFKVSGDVLQYHSKDYLVIQAMQAVRDLNQF